ncbi:hypothetical protein OsJ_11256 [Oryza sativa Japonica Group]|uniref:Uncharacterized protein n=1 Tax=Oryza sativa subsp. japonica TaxID=39947 RepID=B9F903_ORYSJ|nr:hypothetical protein OsJ_11256 [Oryza sativa Japonica Group]
MARYKWQKELRGEVSNVTTAHGPLKLEEKDRNNKITNYYYKAYSRSLSHHTI